VLDPGILEDGPEEAVLQLVADPMPDQALGRKIDLDRAARATSLLVKAPGAIRSTCRPG
jgi:hypothetical protein